MEEAGVFAQSERVLSAQLERMRGGVGKDVVPNNNEM